MKIQLNGFEITTAAINGVMRQCRALSKGLNEAHGCKRDLGWDFHIEAALAECALAKAINQYWTGMGHTIGLSDVGDKHEARHRTTKSDLCLRPPDNPDHEYWLIYGKFGSYEVMGHMKGSEGKTPQFLQESQKNGGTYTFYFVPPENLSQPEPYVQL